MLYYFGLNNHINNLITNKFRANIYLNDQKQLKKVREAALGVTSTWKSRTLWKFEKNIEKLQAKN